MSEKTQASSWGPAVPSSPAQEAPEKTTDEGGPGDGRDPAGDVTGGNRRRRHYAGGAEDRKVGAEDPEAESDTDGDEATPVDHRDTGHGAEHEGEPAEFDDGEEFAPRQARDPVTREVSRGGAPEESTVSLPPVQNQSGNGSGDWQGLGPTAGPPGPVESGARQGPAQRGEPPVEQPPPGSGTLSRGTAGQLLTRLPGLRRLVGSAPEPGSDGRSESFGPGGNGVDTLLGARPSPEDVERRLTLALRETYIDGFRKVAVGSPKGGVGKSSLAYAAGCAIAGNTNIRVCLVDADPEFGATRSLVPCPVPSSIVELARDADELTRFSDLRAYVARNERMRLDVVLNPREMVHKASMGDLSRAYERVDAALGRFYDLVIYDLGIGFSHPQIQTVLSLADELLLVGDSEVVPNDIFADALSYLRGLGFDLESATLAISHRLPPSDESATTGLVKGEHAKQLRRVTEIPYDARLSQLLNRRAFHLDELSLQTRLGVLTTAASCLEGLRSGGSTAGATTGERGA